MVRVLITGAAGMLGGALLRTQPETFETSPVDLPDGDLTQPGVASRLLGQHRPQVVLHCAAMTDVDGCTRDPALAHRVNCEATSHLARACREQSAKLIYVSTDYVFAGDLNRPYHEADTPRPLNPYGESKLCGEQAVAELPDHLVVRTQWLYGPGGKNFVATIVNAARTRDTLRIVSDEWGSPTYTPDLARALWQLAASSHTGIVHVTNSEVCTWHDLATIATREAGLNVRLEAISSADWPSPTVRPRYSPLENRRWRELGYAPLRPWQEAVTEYVREHLSSEAGVVI
ncbi:MAG: dTDP-4-dehydrorhamnose reductase [Armatimonadia bacterium]